MEPTRPLPRRGGAFPAPLHSAPAGGRARGRHLGPAPLVNPAPGGAARGWPSLGRMPAQ